MDISTFMRTAEVGETVKTEWNERERSNTGTSVRTLDPTVPLSSDSILNSLAKDIYVFQINAALS